MSRTVPLLLTCLFAGLAAVPAQAGWNEFWDRVHLDSHRNNCWPQPFTSVDRQATRSYFQGMVANGWRTQNTLTVHDFDTQSHELTDGGKRKVHWIMSSSPEQFKTVWVAQAFERGATATRIDSVQQFLAKSMPGESLPPVVATTKQPHDWSAEYIDAIDRKATESIQAPVLPTFQAAGGGN